MRQNDNQSDDRLKVVVKPFQPKANLTREEARALIALKIPFSTLIELTREQLMQRFPQAFSSTEKEAQE